MVGAVAGLLRPPSTRTRSRDGRTNGRAAARGPTDESAPETEDARGGSPSTSAREARTVGATPRGDEGGESSGEVYAGKGPEVPG